ncbi:MAG: hypothetical protein LBU11_10070 [Zoogloeaceae bacterium]|nr:hypothetical protein [Zoogloeaceae bacterium]
MAKDRKNTLPDMDDRAHTALRKLGNDLLTQVADDLGIVAQTMAHQQTQRGFPYPMTSGANA